MILLTFLHHGAYCLGIKTPQGILDVDMANQAMKIAGLPVTPEAVYEHGIDALPALQTFVERALAAEDRASWLLDEARIEYGPCLPRPGKIICVGLNYRKHARESNMEPPPVPVLFSKYQNSVAAPNQPVPLPEVGVKYDYEAELAVVIGRRARYVSEDQALNYVLGYCNANDVSARELQFLSSQWMLGKTLDKFMPLGPYLVTADEAPDPQIWPVRCWFNGELRQNSNTSDMIFSVKELISFISRYFTLEPGDLISTGTPEGVIHGRKGADQVWMKPGDTMTVEVGPLGKLTNDLAAETI
jgi:2-keto-4-pentenoate hydratase/2-oxohepta-3-ene-1,7-dioic acid hydratase in catechol pathway